MSVVLRYTVVVFCLFLSTTSGIKGQGSIFGPKGGLAFGLQTWNGYDREPLLAYHGALYVESNRESGLGALFAEVGYHTRGSSENVFFFTGGGSGFRSKQNFKFNNLSAIFGAKKYFKPGSGSVPYFGFGLRLDYTLSTNLSQYETYAGYFPLEFYVNKFNYGGSASAGYTFPFSELIGAFIEISVHPDFSKQYEQPGGIAIISPLTGQSIRLREQSIRNISFEVSLGFRFVHKVIYLD